MLARDFPHLAALSEDTLLHHCLLLDDNKLLDNRTEAFPWKRAFAALADNENFLHHPLLLERSGPLRENSSRAPSGDQFIIFLFAGATGTLLAECASCLLRLNP